MSNNDVKIDHEAAKKWAEDVLTRLCPLTEDTKNLAACYLDAMARLDKAEKAGESWKDAYFKLIRAIGSSPNCSKSPVSIAQELLAQRDEAEKLRGVAHGLLDVAVKERDEALALLEEIEIPLARCDGELSAIYHRGTVERDNCKAFSKRARELGVKLASFLAKHRKRK